MVDIGLDMTLQAWFRQERFTTICFDNELYANTGALSPMTYTPEKLPNDAPLYAKIVEAL